MGFVKWVGGVLGWALGGPIGALFGFALGSMIDPAVKNARYNDARGAYERRQQTTTADFNLSLLALMAAVMKADGKKLKSELDVVKAFLAQLFPKQNLPEVLSTFKQLLDKDIPVRDVCMQIRQNMDHSSRLELFRLLFEIAFADKVFQSQEESMLKMIASYLGISEKDYLSIKAMYVPDTDSAYKILEVDPNVSDDEVRKAYRRMAVKYHPDKVANLGEDHVKKANEKFAAVNEAWNIIKKERGLV